MKIHISLKLLVIVFLFASCLALKKIANTEEFSASSKSTLVGSKYSNYSIKTILDGEKLKIQLFGDIYKKYKVISETILGQKYQHHDGVSMALYLDKYDAIRAADLFANERLNIRGYKQPSFIGSISYPQYLYISDVPYKGRGPKHVVIRAIVPASKFGKPKNEPIFRNNSGLEYIQVYGVQRNDSKVLSSSDILMLQKLNDNTQEKLEYKEEKITGSVPISICSLRNDELNYFEEFNPTNGEVEINLDLIANRFSTPDLSKSYVFKLIAYTSVNGRQEMITKDITIDLSKYLKSDIVFVEYKIVNDKRYKGYTPGIYNSYWDAGEQVDFYLTLRNVSENYYISSSAFLSVEDPFIEILGDNIRFDEIYPGRDKRSITPITLFINPNTPNDHSATINAKILDSGFEKVNFTSFPIKIYNVGPVEFEKAIVDDDNLGGSWGDSDGILEKGEIIELIIFIRNNGVVDLKRVTAKLKPSQSSNNFVTILDDKHEYEILKSRQDKSIPADYDIRLNENIGNSPIKLTFTLSIIAQADFGGFYKWESDFELYVNAKDPKLTKLVKQY